jgi:hypothetical protein
VVKVEPVEVAWAVAVGVAVLPVAAAVKSAAVVVEAVPPPVEPVASELELVPS